VVSSGPAHCVRCLCLAPSDTLVVLASYYLAFSLLQRHGLAAVQAWHTASVVPSPLLRRLLSHPPLTPSIFLTARSQGPPAAARHQCFRYHFVSNKEYPVTSLYSLFTLMRSGAEVSLAWWRTWTTKASNSASYSSSVPQTTLQRHNFLEHFLDLSRTFHWCSFSGRRGSHRLRRRLWWIRESQDVPPDQYLGGVHRGRLSVCVLLYVRVRGHLRLKCVQKTSLRISV
jgi:hypothetical protein